MRSIVHPASFFTATNLNWQPLLSYELHKQIIIKSLVFLKKDLRILLYGFVIMPNHIYLIWQPLGKHLAKENQHNFLKYTAQQIKFNLMKQDRVKLKMYRVNAADRKYQFWERNPLSIELY